MAEHPNGREYLVNTQPHARNKSYRIIVRDLTKNVIVNQISGGQVKRPWTMQVLQSGHLVVGYSTVRPFDFDFINEEGQLYNRIESDCERCWVLKNGLLVEVVGKQTIIKQIMPEFKAPRLIQVYDIVPQWVGLFDKDILLAHTWHAERGQGHLHLLQLSQRDIETSIPVAITNVVLNGKTLYGTTAGGDYIQRMCLDNWLENGFVRTYTAPVEIRRQKVNNVSLTYINDDFLLYKNAQKSHVHSVETLTYHLIDWKKQRSIWYTHQEIQVIATSPRGMFVYFDEDANAYNTIVCGSSLVNPIAALAGMKPKGQSHFMSNGTFVFHGEKRIVVLDLDASTILAQYDVSRHVCDLMAVSKWNYKERTKAPEAVPETTVDDGDDAKHVADIQAMIDAKVAADGHAGLAKLDAEATKPVVIDIKPEAPKVEIVVTPAPPTVLTATEPISSPPPIPPPQPSPPIPPPETGSYVTSCSIM